MKIVIESVQREDGRVLIEVTADTGEGLEPIVSKPLSLDRSSSLHDVIRAGEAVAQAVNLFFVKPSTTASILFPDGV